MPPKKKGKGKKGAKARSPTLVNGLTIDESTKEQLEDHIAQLREELNRERDERNYFQLERDEITSYWKITERELEVAKAELRKLDKDIEEDEERHRVELKVYKQKMKHLLCEHQNAISEVKADSSVSIEALQKEQEQVEMEIHKNMRCVLVDTQELDIEHLVKELELKHEEEMTETRNNWEKQLLEIKAKYKKKMHFLRTELDNIRKNQTGEREDHCNSHIDALVEDHNRAFNEANLLVSQMQQDVDMNMSLKRQIKDMRMSQKEKEKELVPILQDNKRLAKLLLSVKDQIKEKEKKMRNCIPKGSDNHIERVKKKELDDARAEFQTLEQNFLKIQQEREELYKAQSIQMVQQRVDVKIEMLERKMKSITESLERTQAQLCSVLSAPNMDQTALAGVANEIEQNLDASNDTIKSLQYKKAQISKALKDLHLTFEVKQRAIGVPVEELCAKPPESSHVEKPTLFLDIPTQNPLSS